MNHMIPSIGLCQELLTLTSLAIARVTPSRSIMTRQQEPSPEISRKKSRAITIEVTSLYSTPMEILLNQPLAAITQLNTRSKQQMKSAFDMKTANGAPLKPNRLSDNNSCPLSRFQEAR